MARKSKGVFIFCEDHCVGSISLQNEIRGLWGQVFLNFNDFSEIVFEIWHIMENGHFRDDRRVISRQRIELFQFRKKRLLRLIKFYQIRSN